MEVEAGALFHSVGMTRVADDVPDPADLHTAVKAGRVWVCEVGTVVAAYVVAEVLDANAHVAQVSVAPSYAGRGLGRQLLELVETAGRAAGRPATTLTTFRDVPWNAPYYERLGYAVLREEEIGPELRRTMEHEASLPGLDASPRVAMARPNRVAD